MGGSKPIWQKELRVLEKPIFAKLRVHKCFLCGELLELMKVRHFQIKKGSPEARHKVILHFDIFNHPVDYIFHIFKCTVCENKLSINDQYYMEKPYKKKSKFYNRQLSINDYSIYLQSQDRKNGGEEYQKYLKNIRKNFFISQAFERLPKKMF